MDNELLQAIGNLLDEKLAPIDQRLINLETDMIGVKADMVEMRTDMVDMKADMTEMKVDMTGMKADMTGMKADMTNMQADMKGLKQEVVKINLRIENEIIPNIKALAEGHQTVVYKLDRIENTVDEMSATVLALDIIHKK